jgi:phage shock protein C
MFCQGCGKDMGSGSNFCSSCGRKVDVPALPPPQPMQQQRLVRSRSNRVIAGVCAGLAYHLGIDPTMVRLLTVILTFFVGFPLLAYIIAWVIIPEEQLYLPGAQMVGPVGTGPITPQR